MEIKNAKIEAFLKSFTFSLLLCMFWSYFCITGVKSLIEKFDFVQLLWLTYNIIISLLFLIRTRPAVVSTNPLHWIVALATSFSGFFFSKIDIIHNSNYLIFLNVLLTCAILLGIITAIILGKSYDFLPALREVKIKYVYNLIRHPMYLSSIIIKIVYTSKNPLPYNIILLVVIIFLYDKRTKYEEEILSKDISYIEYMQKVKYRFIPGIY
jgi:protein-S-isoprenylcysteine O-methyltransferase Ste14